MKDDIEYCVGYFKHHPYKPYYDSDFRLRTLAEFIYDKTESVKAFDENGKEIGFINKNKRSTRVEDNILSDVFRGFNKCVIQVDYEFHLFEHKGCWTVEEVNDVIYALNNSNLGGFDEAYREKDSMDSINRDIESHKSRGWDIRMLKKRLKQKIRIAEPVEICSIGNTRQIEKKQNKKVLKLDVSAYKKRKDDFVKLNPDYAEQTEWLYNSNIDSLCTYFNCTESALFNNPIAKTNGYIKRLNIKINEKEKSFVYAR